ncbi:MAG: aldose 1-epimerase family protein [Novosphingobium sp.]
MADFISIASDRLTARINPLGAELWSLTDTTGREYMTDADPAFWTGHAPLLFPIVGALNGGRYRLDGREYPMPKHGFARASHFTCVEASESRALFRLSDCKESRTVYPFSFELLMGFRLRDWTLEMEATVRNTGDTGLPFSFGFHPAFAWPLPGADKAAHRVTFAEPEPQPIRCIDADGLVLPEAKTSPVQERVIAPDASMFEADALIWDRLNSRALIFGAGEGPSLDIAFPDTPMLGIWQKPGANYLCIEPWQGIADPQGFDGDFRDKPGVITISPGSERSFRMDVTILPGA